MRKGWSRWNYASSAAICSGAGVRSPNIRNTGLPGVRNTIEKMMNDPTMKMPDDAPFDPQRMIFGGFEPVLVLPSER